MTDQYLHGVELLEVTDGVRSITTLASSVIGIIGTAPDADPDIWPINTPILIPGNPYDAATLGETGTLTDAINDIFSLTNATIVVVRVTQGNSMPATWSNIIGSAVLKTGVYAFLNAPTMVGLTPRLLLAPGYTSVRPTDALSGGTVGTGGAGYTKATYPVTISGNGQGATGHAVVVSGAVSAIVIDTPGFGYTSATITIPAPDAASGTKTQATATAVFGADKNPVAGAMEAVANRLRACMVVEGPNTTDTDAVTYRGDFDNKRVMVIDPLPLVWDIDSSEYVAKPSSPLAIAQQVIMDRDYGFWWTFSNQEIPTIGGTSRPIGFALSDPASESNYLNSQQITTIIRNGGFRFWGVRTTSSDPDWAFWNVVRTADIIDDSVAKAIAWALDRPFSKQLLVDLVESINDYLSDLKALGAILGGTASIDPNVNSHDQLKAGILRIDFDREPPAPMEHIILGAHRNAAYYDIVIADVLATLAAA